MQRGELAIMNFAAMADITRENARAGLDRARNEGKRFGRSRIVDRQKVTFRYTDYLSKWIGKHRDVCED